MSAVLSKRNSDAVIAIALAVALTLLAFITTGSGVDESITVSAANTWVEIVLTLLGAGAVGALIYFRAGVRGWGAATVLLFAALTALTALSITWSVQPDNSWQAANLTLAYLGAFAGAVALARLAALHWRALVGAVAITMVAICAYALATKVFPSTSDTFGRLQAPLGYWNATGLAAALGLAPCLWAFNRDELPTAIRGLAVPAVAILIAVVVLSYSRSALLAALIGIAFWLVFVPRKLNSALLLACGAIGAAVIAGWALSTPALTSDNVAFAARTSAGHTFGIVLLVTVVLLIAAGIVIARAQRRVVLADGLRRRIGTVLLVGVALLPLLAVLALAESSRGLTGEISHAWSSLTNVNSTTGNSASRVFALGSSRPLYWSEGITVGEHALFKGVGALGYAIARTRYTTNPDVVVHAHSYVIQTFADLGLIGLALTLALLVAWVMAAAQALALGTRADSLTAAAAGEREGLVALATVVLVFGLQSAIDWTWYFPGVTVPALLCAGWLAGRGPLLEIARGAERRGSLLARPAAGAAVAALTAIALLLAWLIWQPLGSADDVSSAYAAIGAGDLRGAYTDAQSANSADPLALQPIFVLAALDESARQPAAARSELVSAVRQQPDNPASWFQLGSFDLTQHRPRLAVASLQRAHALDPTDTQTAALLAQAAATKSPGAKLSARHAPAAGAAAAARRRRRRR